MTASSIRASRSPARASYAITQADLNNGSVTNTAKASAGGIDSNEDKATVTVTPPPPPSSAAGSGSAGR